MSIDQNPGDILGFTGGYTMEILIGPLNVRIIINQPVYIMECHKCV